MLEPYVDRIVILTIFSENFDYIEINKNRGK